MTIKLATPTLQATLAGLQGDIERAARPMAFAASEVLYRAVRRNVQALGGPTGNLAASIYQAYSPENSGQGKATYHISWNARKAPHGHLVEFGHLQRYVTYLAKNGKFYTQVRPSKRGQPKPGRKASQAVKDAYYVPLPAPKQVPAKSPVRRATSEFPAAEAAAISKLYELLGL